MEDVFFLEQHFPSGGNNFPLRGNKATLWEGGTRAASFVHGKMVAGAGGNSRELIHVTDWLPTLYRAAGGDPSKLEGLDGFDQWETLSKGRASGRVEMLYNIDPLPDMANGPGGAIRSSIKGWFLCLPSMVI